MGLITVEDATFSYRLQPDGESAVRDVSFAIERGEFVGVAGPTDAGKSTFCRLLAGHAPHFFSGELTGSVVVDGTPTEDADVSQLAQTVGFVFQDPFDQLSGTATSVVEEVAFGLENSGVPASEMQERVHRSLERVGISDLADRDPSALSGGQSQRLAVASTLAMRPDVLVLDEPTSQLDPEGSREILRTLTELSDEYAVVVATQELQRVAPLLDRLILLSEGEIAHRGPPREVLSRPEAIEDLVRIPETVRLAERLRDIGVYTDLTPLRTQEVVELVESNLSSDGIGDYVVTETGAGSDSDERTTPRAEESPASTPRVDFRDVSHRYDSGVRALDDVSFSASSGCICLLGQNGAGKSTLVKHLNGLLEPTSGQVLVNGTDTAERRVAELANDVGLCFQNPNDQLFHDTVEAEVRFGPENLGYDEGRTDGLVERTLSQLDLEPVRSANPYDIGLPLRKRVAVGSVLAMDPEVVVLDEPTSGQDAHGRAVLGRTVDALVAEEKLVFVVTHDVEFAREHADRLLVLRDGEIVRDGRPSEVFADHEVLARTNVRSPVVTRVARELGLPRSVLSADELLELVARPNEHGVASRTPDS